MGRHHAIAEIFAAKASDAARSVSLVAAGFLSLQVALALQSPYPEEVFIVSGRLYDKAFHLWLEAGHYASRPPGELHGPFQTDVGCVVLELSFPNRIAGNPAI